MLHGRQVVVVVPAYQEEAHIGAVVRGMPAFVDRIVVVDDGCTDRTSDRAQPAFVVRHPTRRGVGAALATGYRAAIAGTSDDADAIAVMAGDGQMHPDDLERVVAPIVRGEAEYVKGSRFAAPGVRRTMGTPRWVGGQVFSRLTSLAVGQPVTDSQCGFTAVSRRAALALDLDDLWPSFGYPNDLLGQLAVRGARIAEVPVRPIYGRESSKLRLRHLPPIFFLVARAAFRRLARAQAPESTLQCGSASELAQPVGMRSPVTRTDDAKKTGGAASSSI
jgi:glycosyltransferase involved in cell wall biosynthesis